MILYHGSSNIVSSPVFGFGKSTKDFGKGFYCTTDSDLAMEWSCAGGVDGYVNVYQFDLSNLNILDLNSGKFSILVWLAILARYRTYWENGNISAEAKEYLQKHFFVSPENYDVICGYRADNSNFTFAKKFLNGSISLQGLKQVLILGTSGVQIVLKTEKAFSKIKYLGCIDAESNVYIQKAQERDHQARMVYKHLLKEASYDSGIFIMDILRKNVIWEDSLLC